VLLAFLWKVLYQLTYNSHPRLLNSQASIRSSIQHNLQLFDPCSMEAAAEATRALILQVIFVVNAGASVTRASDPWANRTRSYLSYPFFYWVSEKPHYVLLAPRAGSISDSSIWTISVQSMKLTPLLQNPLAAAAVCRKWAICWKWASQALHHNENWRHRHCDLVCLFSRYNDMREGGVTVGYALSYPRILGIRIAMK
jgi:hypothetical protein